jgi:thiosulfate dehydrogenase [quinone] large subunit
MFRIGRWMASGTMRHEGAAMLDRFVRPPITPDQLGEPRWARFLFASTTAGWLWLVVRLYMASVFVPAGWAKVTSGQWLFGDGAPIQGMVGGAVASEGTPGWYSWFLENVVQPNAGLFATLVALGELAVGLGLLVGLLTGIAAFGGVFVNANFVLAGALGSNPALIILGALLALAWRNAGWIGLDRWFLPWIHERRESRRWDGTIEGRT